MGGSEKKCKRGQVVIEGDGLKPILFTLWDYSVDAVWSLFSRIDVVRL